MNFLKEHKRGFIVTLICICLVAITVTLGFRYKPSIFEKALGFVVTPVQSFFTGVGDWFSDRENMFADISELKKDNAKLKEEVEALRAENNQYKYLNEEMDELSNLLDVERKYSDYPKTGAKIIGKDPGNWYNSFIIDKGSQDGLKENMVVLASGGLAGRITQVGFNYAKVVALIDDTSSISAKAARTNDAGFVRGDINLMMDGQCLMVNIDSDAEIVEGDEIVTSHLSSIYPPDIIIGHVVEITDESNETKTAVIKPTVDFRYMETVLVITQLFEHELIEPDVITESPATENNK